MGRGRWETEKYPIRWLIVQVPTWASSGPGWSQLPGAHSWSPHRLSPHLLPPVVCIRCGIRSRAWTGTQALCFRMQYLSLSLMLSTCKVGIRNSCKDRRQAAVRVPQELGQWQGISVSSVYVWLLWLDCGWHSRFVYSPHWTRVKAIKQVSEMTEFHKNIPWDSRKMQDFWK